mgnify:CR=1 FL=1
METLEQLQQMARGFQTSRILLTAFELGIFEALGDNAVPSTAVASECQTDPRATDRLLNALCSLGLLQKEGELFSNTPLAAKHLVRGRPDYVAGFGHINHLWDSWSSLTSAIIRDDALEKVFKEKKEASRTDAFIAAMHGRARSSAPDGWLRQALNR